MRRTTWTLATLVAVAGSAPAAAQEAYDAPVEARIWLDRGEEPTVQRGESVRAYYRTTLDSYVAIFRIDTDGVVHMLMPSHPGADHVTEGGTEYRLLFPESTRWRVYDDPGVGYFFIVASLEPLDFSALYFDRREARWDLGGVAARVYEDPYLAIDDVVAALIPDWEVAPYTLDFISYSVGETHSYPRFLCYQCHEARSYASWNPYAYACSDFRIVLWDDPYYYPAYRYSGTRVVFTTPLRNRPRFTVATRRFGDSWTPLVRRRGAPEGPDRFTQYKEPERARAPVRATPSRRSVFSPQTRPETTSAPSTRRATPRSEPSRSGAAGLLRPPVTRSPAQSPPQAQPRREEERPPTASPTTRPEGRSRPSLIQRLGTAIRNSQGSGAARSRDSNPGVRGSTSRPSTRATVTPPSTTRSQPSTSRTRPTIRAQPRATPSRPSASRARPTARSQPSTSRPRPTVKARPKKPPPRRRGGGGL